MTEKKRLRNGPPGAARRPRCEADYPPPDNPSRTRFETTDNVLFDVADAFVKHSYVMTKAILHAKRLAQHPLRVEPPPAVLPMAAAEEVVPIEIVQQVALKNTPHMLSNVAAEPLEEAMKYCYFHSLAEAEAMSDHDINEWDDNFIKCSPRQLCELASAAYYLDIRDLVDLTCRAIAAIISGKTAEQIRTTFHIENDLVQSLIFPGERGNPLTIRRAEIAKRVQQRKATVNQSTEETVNSDEQEGRPPPDTSDVPQLGRNTIEEVESWINGEDPPKKTNRRRRKKKKNKPPPPSPSTKPSTESTSSSAPSPVNPLSPSVLKDGANPETSAPSSPIQNTGDANRGHTLTTRKSVQTSQREQAVPKTPISILKNDPSSPSHGNCLKEEELHHEGNMENEHSAADEEGAISLTPDSSGHLSMNHDVLYADNSFAIESRDGIDVGRRGLEEPNIVNRSLTNVRYGDKDGDITSADTFEGSVSNTTPKDTIRNGHRPRRTCSPGRKMQNVQASMSVPYSIPEGLVIDPAEFCEQLGPIIGDIPTEGNDNIGPHDHDNLFNGAVAGLVAMKEEAERAGAAARLVALKQATQGPKVEGGSNIDGEVVNPKDYGQVANNTDASFLDFSDSMDKEVEDFENRLRIGDDITPTQLYTDAQRSAVLGYGSKDHLVNEEACLRNGIGSQYGRGNFGSTSVSSLNSTKWTDAKVMKARREAQLLERERNILERVSAIEREINNLRRQSKGLFENLAKVQLELSYLRDTNE